MKKHKDKEPWKTLKRETPRSTVAMPIFLSKMAFSYRFRIVFVSFSNRIVLCRFKRRLKEKRRLNGVFPFSQSQGIDINAVYRLKRCSVSFILLTS